MELNTMRVMGKKHVVSYANNDSTIILNAQYKGATPIRAILSDINKQETTGILVDYIQLVIVQKELELISFDLSDFYIKGEK